MKSSFVRKGKAAASAPALPSGTRLSAQNGSLQISSGLSDFDGTIKTLNRVHRLGVLGKKYDQ